MIRRSPWGAVEVSIMGAGMFISSGRGGCGAIARKAIVGCVEVSVTVMRHFRSLIVTTSVVVTFNHCVMVCSCFFDSWGWSVSVWYLPCVLTEG